jgi:hypothetical protein
MNKTAKVCTSACSAVAASATQMRSPTRKPAMTAGAPRRPRASTRATTAVTGPGDATRPIDRA